MQKKVRKFLKYLSKTHKRTTLEIKKNWQKMVDVPEMEAMAAPPTGAFPEFVDEANPASPRLTLVS